MNATPTPAPNAGVANTDRSTSGASARPCHTRNAAAVASVIAIQPIIIGDIRPWSCSRTRPSTTITTKAVSSAKPGQSKRRRSGGSDMPGSSRAASSQAASANGGATRNTARQPNASTSSPPTDGPTAGASTTPKP